MRDEGSFPLSLREMVDSKTKESPVGRIANPS
jgi:hypothetical protein